MAQRKPVNGVIHLRVRQPLLLYLPLYQIDRGSLESLIHVISTGRELCLRKEYSRTISASASSPLGDVPTKILTGSCISVFIGWIRTAELNV